MRFTLDKLQDCFSRMTSFFKSEPTLNGGCLCTIHLIQAYAQLAIEHFPALHIDDSHAQTKYNICAQ